MNDVGRTDGPRRTDGQMVGNGRDAIWLLQSEPPIVDEGLAGVSVSDGAAESKETGPGFGERPGASDVLIDEQRAARTIDADGGRFLKKENGADGAAIARIKRAVGAAAASAVQGKCLHKTRGQILDLERCAVEHLGE